MAPNEPLAAAEMRELQVMILRIKASTAPILAAARFAPPDATAPIRIADLAEVARAFEMVSDAYLALASRSVAAARLIGQAAEVMRGPPPPG